MVMGMLALSSQVNFVPMNSSRARVITMLLRPLGDLQVLAVTVFLAGPFLNVASRNRQTRVWH